MERKRKVLIVLTILLSIIEFAVSYKIIRGDYFNKIGILEEGVWIINFLGVATPAGIIFLLNYYLISPLLYYVLCLVWLLTGHYKLLANSMRECVENCASWLISIPSHWGVLNTSTECQNANTCEALLALRKSSMSERYESVYKEARQNLLNDLSERGLQSKSLNNETVVCTSMILYLLALDHEAGESFSYELEEKINKIANNLWCCKSERGWGVYMENFGDEYSCVANTFWALLALNKCDIGRQEEFIRYIKKIYEFSNDSLYGFTISDSPRVCTTALASILYFSLDANISQQVDKVFDICKAINYIFEHFCLKNIQCETETLRGIDLKCPGSKKAPWTHMTMGYAMEALGLAYRNNKLSLIKKDIFVAKLRRVCKSNLTNVQRNHCYFMPEGMEIKQNGIYTFPTSYFLMGMSEFLKYN